MVFVLAQVTLWGCYEELVSPIHYPPAPALAPAPDLALVLALDLHHCYDEFLAERGRGEGTRAM